MRRTAADFFSDACAANTDGSCALCTARRGDIVAHVALHVRRAHGGLIAVAHRSSVVLLSHGLRSLAVDDVWRRIVLIGHCRDLPVRAGHLVLVTPSMAKRDHKSRVKRTEPQLPHTVRPVTFQYERAVSDSVVISCCFRARRSSLLCSMEAARASAKPKRPTGWGINDSAWLRYWSDSQQRPYYFNKTSNTTTYDPPRGTFISILHFILKARLPNRS